MYKAGLYKWTEYMNKEIARIDKLILSKGKQDKSKNHSNNIKKIQFKNT